MTSPAKITFGNNPTTSYTLNTNPNFAYQSGDNIASSYSPYNLGTTGQNLVTTNSYSAYEAPRQVSYGGNYRTQPYSTSFSSGQVTNPVGVSYEANRNVTYASPAAKVTFGNKSYTPTYAPTTSTYQANYQYTAPAPVQYQTYQTYQQPVEIVSQPIRTEMRDEVIVEAPKVEAVPQVRRSQVTAPVVEPIKETKAKKEKSGCPKWLWPLLGILALLALIIGLLFGLGVFGRIGGGAAPTISGGSSSPTIAGTTTGGAAASGDVSGTTTGGATTGVTSPTGYTVIEETIVLSKDNKTSTTTGITAPTVDVTTPTVNVPTVTIPTVNVPTITMPTVTIPTTTTDDQFAIEPTAVAPVEVPVTTTYTTSVPTTTTTWSTTGTSSNRSGSTADNTVTGTTYPTNSYNGYGSNPVLNTTTTRSSSVDSSSTPASVDYVLPTSAY